MQDIFRVPCKHSTGSRLKASMRAIGWALGRSTVRLDCGWTVAEIWHGSGIVEYLAMADTEIGCLVPPDHVAHVLLWIAPRECWATLTLHPFSGNGRVK